MPEHAATSRLALTVNGIKHDVEVEDRLTLVEFLRHRLGRPGTHIGC